MDPILGTIMMIGFNWAPVGWMLCTGQLLAINQYQALFALLGTTYGGDGITNFALPKLPHTPNPLPSGLEIIAIQGIYPSRG